MWTQPLSTLTADQNQDIADARNGVFATRRPTVPALEEILHQPFPMLDYGFLRVVDYMGDDAAITQAARVSYGRGTKTIKDDAALIRYMVRHRHTSPLEMCEIKLHVKLPIFVARQWIRHRTACLAGDVKLTFDLPGGMSQREIRAYVLTVKEVFDRFQPTRNATRPDKQCYSYFKRDRIRGMLLRSCDEDNMTPYHTSIVDIWESGIKPIYKLDFGDGKVLRASADHLCFTNMGWLRLIEAVDSGAWFVTSNKTSGYVSYTPEFTMEDQAAEEWRPLPSCPKYEISSMGRVRSLFNNRNNLRQYPEVKEQTYTPAGYLVVSLSENGTSRARFVHHLVLEAFCPEQRNGRQTRHGDNNRANNRLTNLCYGTALENHADRFDNGCDQRLSIGYTQPLSVTQDGSEMTYDMSVNGPYHNFCAGGVYVHNSVNEMSARYSILDKEFYIPDPDRLAAQSTANRQGSGNVLTGQEAEEVLNILRNDAERNYADYALMLNEGDTSDPNKQGLARELARMNLTLNTYTQWYWKTDLHNLFHFLGLRADSHAQYEIRVYAEKMLEIAQLWVPEATKAFEDYRHQAKALSRMEVSLVRDLLEESTGPLASVLLAAQRGDPALIKTITEDYGMSKRELVEFVRDFLPPITEA